MNEIESKCNSYNDIDFSNIITTITEERRSLQCEIDNIAKSRVEQDKTYLEEKDWHKLILTKQIKSFTEFNQIFNSAVKERSMEKLLYLKKQMSHMLKYCFLNFKACEDVLKRHKIRTGRKVC